MVETITYSVKFELESQKTTAKEQAEAVFMQEYFSLAAVLWATQKLSAFYKENGLSQGELLEFCENVEFLNFVALALLHDMSGRMQKQFLLDGGENL